VETSGNQKFYQANERAPVYAELVGLVRKTVGIAGPLQAALAPLAHRIAAAFVYGSVAKGSDHAASDIDLMVIADDLVSFLGVMEPLGFRHIGARQFSA
jgi:hypothetical protein